MGFISKIISFFNDLSSYSYNAYLEVNSWVFPLYNLAPPLYALSLAFNSIAWQFYYFNNWCVDVWGRVQAILTEGDIWSILAIPISYAQVAYQWIVNAASNVWSIIGNWWSTIQPTILSWIEQAKAYALSLYNILLSSLVSLQAAWNNFVDKIPTIDEIIAWFRNWWGEVLAKIIAWWREQLPDIQSLINSTLLSWFPFYDEFVSIYSTIREFFADPLQWLYDRMEEFFERFW